MSNLGMQLELSMTAKGVQATLKDAQGAIVQTAQVVKSQLGPGGTADQGLSKFKENLSRSREAAMFFTSSLGEFGPAGRTAQMALSGIAGAIMGGGGILLALEGAKVAVRLLSEVWGENAEAANKAREEMARAADESKRKMAELAEEIERTRLAAAGLSGEQVTATLRTRKASEEFEVAARTVQQLKDEIAELRANPYIGSENRIAGLSQELAKWEQASKAASDYLTKLAGLQGLQAAAEEQKGARARAATAGRNLRGDIPAGTKPKAKPLRESVGFEGYEDDGRGLADLRKLEAADYARSLAAAEKATKEMEAKAKRVADAYAEAGQRMGEAIGTAFADMITGSRSVSQAMAGMLKSIVGMVLDSVKAQIMANAAAAAAEAAKSQAGIPVVGPILAGGAMVAMLSLVQGLVNQIPSAAGGWERVPNDTMALIHKDEQVLPATYAEGLRNLVAGGGGGITVNIQATDAKSVRRLFLENNGALAEAIGRAARDGRRFG